VAAFGKDKEAKRRIAEIVIPGRERSERARNP
jgi:hypothetical protein